MNINERIQLYRKNADLSQEQLAEKMGVSRQTVSKWESGQVNLSVDRLQELCRVLGISLAELFGVDTQNTPQVQHMGDEFFTALLTQTETLQKKQNRKLLLISVLFGVALCLVTGLSYLFLQQRLARTESRMDGLASSIGQLSANMHYPDNTTTAETSVADFTYHVSNVNHKEKTLALTLWALPKTVTEGTAAEFIVSGQNNRYSAEALSKDGGFYAELTVAASDDYNIQLRLTKDGVAENHPIDTLYGLGRSYIMDISSASTVESRLLGKNLTISGQVELLADPAYNGDTATNYPVSATIFIKDGSKLLYTETRDLLEGMDFTENFCSDCHYFFPIDLTVEGYQGQNIAITYTLTDNLDNVWADEVVRISNP